MSEHPKLQELRALLAQLEQGRANLAGRLPAALHTTEAIGTSREPDFATATAAIGQAHRGIAAQASRAADVVRQRKRRLARLRWRLRAIIVLWVIVRTYRAVVAAIVWAIRTTIRLVKAVIDAVVLAVRWLVHLLIRTLVEIVIGVAGAVTVLLVVSVLVLLLLCRLVPAAARGAGGALRATRSDWQWARAFVGRVAAWCRRRE